jgi:hypothetical protein
MTTLEQRYIDYYTPLIRDFVSEVESLPHPDIKRMPEPHFPLFGKDYETSALRLAIIGQDTRSWGDIKDFIVAERATPGGKLKAGLEEFRDRKFTEWGNSRQTFWGFAMMMLAAMHGQENWGMMKQGKMLEILDSFAWGNCNAIELYESTPSKMGVPSDYWNAVRQAGERFNRFRHIVETLRPQVAIILYRGLNPSTYFEGYKYDVISRDGRLVHFHLPEISVDVIHAPHPQSMNRIEGADHFLAKIRELFLQHKITIPFPKFLSGQAEGREVREYLLKRMAVIGPGQDKYEFVARVAEELAKRETFMSVPALMDLVNAKGGRTDYGTEFSGGRGSYKLVSGTYKRMIDGGTPERARNVAVAFCRPNFEYAYEHGLAPKRFSL